MGNLRSRPVFARLEELGHIDVVKLNRHFGFGHNKVTNGHYSECMEWGVTNPSQQFRARGSRDESFGIVFCQLPVCRFIFCFHLASELLCLWQY